MKLTGKRRLRLHKPLFGKPLLVLQVEETGYVTDCVAGRIDSFDVTCWRDACVTDLDIPHD